MYVEYEDAGKFVVFNIVNVPLLPTILPVNHYYFFNVLLDLVQVATGFDAIHPYEHVKQLEDVLPEHVLHDG